MRAINRLCSCFALLFLACNGSAHRPAKVPNEALWVGAPDGGVWIYCKVDSDRDVNVCKVYNEFTGDMMAAGDYVSIRSKSAITNPVYSAFDGHVILLQNGDVLTPVIKTPDNGSVKKKHANRSTGQT